MANSARVLVVGDGQEASESRIGRTLRERGFASTDAPLNETGALPAACRRPDVVVLDMARQQAGDSLERFLKFARMLKSCEATAKIPIIAVEGREGGRYEGVRAPDVDDIVCGPLNELQVCARVNSLMRLSTMHEELVRRLDTSARYGVDAPVVAAAPVSVEDATVLVVGATESFPVIEKALHKQATLVGALTMATALDYLSRRRFDAVLLDIDRDTGPALEICREIRRNSRLYNLPVLLLSSLALLDDPETVFGEGVTDIVAKPLDIAELEGRVATLIRELRFRDSLRAIYREARHMATSDGLTGLYSRGFLLEHLENVLKDAKAHAREFSFAFLSISNLERINSECGYVFGDRIIRQVGEMMGMLVRGEDLTARYAGGTFCIILPDTPPDDAAVAVRRITSVVRSTELAPSEHGAPIAVDLIASVIGSDGCDSAEEIVEKARSRLG